MTTLDPGALAHQLGDARRRGNRWRCRCPLCGEDNLELRITADGTFLLHCWSGCRQVEVVNELKRLGLWPTTPAPAAPTTTTRAMTRARNGASPSPSPSSSPSSSPSPSPAGTPTRYVLRGPDGRPVAVHVRLDTPSGKVLWWERPDGTRGLGGLRTTDLPLYNIHLLNGAGEVVVVEGEKAAEALWSVGIPAVGTVTGASTIPGDDALLPLLGRTISLWPDHDEPGRTHMARIGHRLIALGADPQQVRWVAWPQAPAGGDAADYLAAGHGAEDARRLLAQARPWTAIAGDVVEAAAAARRPWEQEPGPGPGPGQEQTSRSETSALAPPAELAPAHAPWPEIAGEAFHGLAGDVVRALTPFTEADPVALLASFLAGVSAALGPGVYCTAGADRHALRIWACLVGATAKARKGSSLAPVRAVLERADSDFRSRVMSGLSSGEGVIYHTRDPITTTGREKQKDGSVRFSEMVTDHGVPDKRLLIVEEEFASTLKICHRDGNVLSAVLRQCWDRGDLSILTKNNPIRATNAHVVVLGHAVAEEVTRYLTESEIAGGLANRFLWLLVRRSKCLPRGGRLPEETLAAIAERLREVLQWAARFTAQTGGEIQWGAAAGRMWDDVYPDLSEGKPGLYGAVVARMEAQALRLAGLYAVLDRSPEIAPDHLAAALAIVDYAEASARYLFGDRLGDPVADAIVDALRRHGTMSRTDLSGLFGRHVSAARISQALTQLAGLGLARPAHHQTGGRPGEYWSWTGHAPGPGSPRG